MTVQRPSRWRIAVVLASFGAVVAACSSAQPSNAPESASPSSHALVIGQMAPQAGPLFFNGLPQFTGVRLAVQDINARGGVLGHAVKLVVGTDSIRTSTMLASTHMLIKSHSDAVIGSPGSSISAFDALVASRGLPQCASASTAPVATVRPMSRLSIRTTPPNDTPASVIASEAAGTGAKSVGIIARNDAYGTSLAQAVTSALQGKGVTIAKTAFYDPAMAGTTPAVGQVVAAKPGAFVVIGFAEGAEIVASLLQAGVKPATIVGSPGMFIPTLNTIISPNDPSRANGLIVVGVGGDVPFNERLARATRGQLSYGAQSYDCAMIIALAAVQAKSVEPAKIAKHLVSITTGANLCSTFTECDALLAKGMSIAYVGPSGPLALDHRGNPTSGRIMVGQFKAGSLYQLSSSDVPASS